MVERWVNKCSPRPLSGNAGAKRRSVAATFPQPGLAVDLVLITVGGGGGPVASSSISICFGRGAVPARVPPVLPGRLTVSVICGSVGGKARFVIRRLFSSGGFHLRVDHGLFLAPLDAASSRGVRTIRWPLVHLASLGRSSPATAGGHGSIHRPLVALLGQFIPTTSRVVPLHGGVVTPPSGLLPGLTRLIWLAWGSHRVAIGGSRLQRGLSFALARLSSRPCMRQGCTACDLVDKGRTRLRMAANAAN